jgi:hypothetical protein
LVQHRYLWLFTSGLLLCLGLLLAPGRIVAAQNNGEDLPTSVDETLPAGTEEAETAEIEGAEAGANPAGDVSTATGQNASMFLPVMGLNYEAVPPQPPLCRIGVNGSVAGFGFGSVTGYNFAHMRLSWYVDYHGTIGASRPNGIEYAPMIRLVQTGPNSYRYSIYPNYPQTTEAELRALIDAFPGVHWYIGNEPDRQGLQDDIEPQVYAKAYHELYHLIKARDPEAIIIAGSIVQPTPLRIQYLDMVLDSYQARYNKQMPVDAWAIHNFILNEASCDHFNEFECWGAGIPPGVNAIEGLRVGLQDNDNFDLFVEQILRFRKWLADRGYRGAPVYLSEYGVLMPDVFAPPEDFPPARVNAFMNKTFDYLLSATDPELGNPLDGYRLIQRFSWYSMNDASFNGYLFERDQHTGRYRTSPMGDNLIKYVSRIKLKKDLFPVEVTTEPATPVYQGTPLTLKVKAVIANSGNNGLPVKAVVRFYEGDPTQGGTQVGEDQIVSLPGCGETKTVTTQWVGWTNTRGPLYVLVDPDGKVEETDKSNNLMKR